jgi:hypothetical protein
MSDDDDFAWRVRRAKRLREHAHWQLRWNKMRPLSPQLVAIGVKPMAVEKAKEALREAIQEIQKARMGQ